MLHHSVTYDSCVSFSSSWTTITNATGSVLERRSFDAWGNLRDAQTWSGIPQRLPKYDRGYTGHEHLYSFGLINMNGRMYDPALSAFLSPDNYMQDVTTQQGFNRYAYCMYNPLKYVDPSGELCRGWGSSTYYLEMAFKNMMKERYSQYLELMEMTLNHINEMIDGLFSMGDNTGGMLGENHGCGGGGCRAYTRFNRHQQSQPIHSSEGRCVLTSLGSIFGGDSTAEWEARSEAYRATFGKNPFDPKNIIDFINWNPDPEKYHTYECIGISFNEICDAMNEGYVVSALCDFTSEAANYYDLSNHGHFVNLSYIEVQDNSYIDICFNDHPANNYMPKYNLDSSLGFNLKGYKTINYYNGNSIQVLESIRFIKIKLIP